jgi:hypothetical protein
VPISQNPVHSGLAEIASATTVEQCLQRVQEQTERLFGPVIATVRFDADDRPANAFSVELSARGHRIGQLDVAVIDESAFVDPDELMAIADHAAIALDNARLLESYRQLTDQSVPRSVTSAIIAKLTASSTPRRSRRASRVI